MQHKREETEKEREELKLDKEIQRGEVTNVFKVIEMGAYGIALLITISIFIPYGWTFNIAIAGTIIWYARKIQKKIKEREKIDKNNEEK